MKSDIQQTLCELFHQVIDSPDTLSNTLSNVPIEDWAEGSEEWKLLTDFHTMLNTLQRSHQDALRERKEIEEQLREKEEQYRSIFEATSDGLIIRDLDGFAVEANPAVCRMHGYSYEEFIGLPRSAIVHPQSHAAVAAYIKAIQEGQTFLGQAIEVRKDGSTFPAEVRGSTFIYLGKPHMLTVLRDVTERVEAEKQLREREEQYRNIFEATSDALFITNLEDGRIVEANPAACSLYGYDYRELIGQHSSALIPPEQLPMMVESFETIQDGGQFLAQGLAVRKDGTVFYGEGHASPFNYKGKPHMLAVIHNVTEKIQAQQLLEQRVEERTRELSSLLEVSHTVASTLELKPLLNLILEQLRTVVNYDGAVIAMRQEDGFTFLDYQGPLLPEQVTQLRQLFARSAAHLQVLQSGEPVIIPDTHDTSPLARSLQVLSQEHLASAFIHVKTWMGIPLKLKDRVIGMMTVSAHQPNYYTLQHAKLALAIANQAAIAIENAQLYEQAQQLAAVEERQRLARELHDSVSQALYGISLGTHTARRLLDHDPTQLAEPLDYVLSLAETALVEMRELIFELRPESLESEGLVAALTKLAKVLQMRYHLAVSTMLCDEPDLSLKAKQELYRIAQEAMHNTAKHAHASTVDLRLRWTQEGLLLEVQDNGVGFDTAASFPGHLGLHSMRERTSRLNGTFQIESTSGLGTSIRVLIPGRDPR